MKKIWFKYLPINLRQKLESSVALAKILDNIGWLFFDRFLKMGVGLFVGVWLARYLGPEQFGLLNYALAFIALFSPIASLGLNGVVVRELVNKKDAPENIMGTTFLMLLSGGGLAYISIVIITSMFQTESNSVKLIISILGLGLIFKASDIIKYWFESQVESKYIVWIENSLYIVFSLFKITLIITQQPLIVFVWLILFEGVLASVCFLIVYAVRTNKIIHWKIKLSTGKRLLRDSWPLIFSGLAIMLYMRIDQIMLGEIRGSTEVGIYSAAVRISEVWYFIPTVIIASLFPAILNAKKTEEKLYQHRLQQLYELMVVMGVLVAIPMTFLATPLMLLLFGQDYIVSGQVLAIHIWASIFVFLGVASSRWLLTENLQKFSMYRTLIGAFVNVVLNLVLISDYGAVGAAVATVVSYFVSTFSVCFFKQTRLCFNMMIRAFVPLRLIDRLFGN